MYSSTSSSVRRVGMKAKVLCFRTLVGEPSGNRCWNSSREFGTVTVAGLLRRCAARPRCPSRAKRVTTWRARSIGVESGGGDLLGARSWSLASSSASTAAAASLGFLAATAAVCFWRESRTRPTSDLRLRATRSGRILAASATSSSRACTAAACSWKRGQRSCWTVVPVWSKMRYLAPSRMPCLHAKPQRA